MKLFERFKNEKHIFCVVIHVKLYFRSLNHILYEKSMNTRFTGFSIFFLLISFTKGDDRCGSQINETIDTVKLSYEN